MIRESLKVPRRVAKRGTPETREARAEHLDSIAAGINILRKELDDLEKNYLQVYEVSIGNPEYEAGNLSYVDDLLGNLVRGVSAIRGNWRGLEAICSIERAMAKKAKK